TQAGLPQLRRNSAAPRHSPGKIAPQSEREMARSERGTIMRHKPTTRAQQLRLALQLIQIFTATLAPAILLLAFATRAQAETLGCGGPSMDGLMTKAEAGTGTLLLKTATPGRYLPAPRVATDIAVDIAGPIARTKITQRFENP